jgi:hypothetical protein
METPRGCRRNRHDLAATAALEAAARCGAPVATALDLPCGFRRLALLADRGIAATGADAS